MKKDRIFKEKGLENSPDLNKYLMNGYFIVAEPQYNSKTDTIDYHLRKTILSWIMNKLIKG